METLTITDASEGELYLTFRLDEELYGIGILNVQEIIGVLPIMRIPKMPAWVRGAINLRGRILPVIDLRSKFNMGSREDTHRSCIVVLQVGWESTTITIGVLVDEVAEVLELNESQIEPAPALAGSIDGSFLDGIGKSGDRVVILLNCDRLLRGAQDVANPDDIKSLN